MAFFVALENGQKGEKLNRVRSQQRKQRVSLTRVGKTRRTMWKCRRLGGPPREGTRVQMSISRKGGEKMIVVGRLDGGELCL
jgi:hypothetical protein